MGRHSLHGRQLAMSELEVQGDAIIVSTFVVAAIGEVPDLPGVACRLEWLGRCPHLGQLGDLP